MAINWFRRFTKRTAILLNVIVALLFILSCYGTKLNPQFFWFMGLLNLVSFYFLILLLFFILFWLFASFKYVTISIIAIVLAWVPIRQLVEIRFTPNFVAAKHPANLRVMSWNVEHFSILEHKLHPEKKQAMLALINQYNPDVACFQEVVASDSIPGAINYLPDLMASLNMIYYIYSYNRKIDFDQKHHFGIIILSKYPLLNKHTLSYEPHDYNSIFQYADLVKAGDTFRIFNLHLQSLKFTENNRRYINTPELETKKDIEESKNLILKFKHGFLLRHFQSDRIRKAINESVYPVVVCGDFNDVPNSYAYRTIGKGLKNAFAEKGTGLGRTFIGISPTLRIDNIFADNHFDVEQYVRIKKSISDHYPIVADLFFHKE
ncbi:MAG: endonuclease/exonuclease/phosphatase family protein [Niastella sp.]|nr:endonuclease/exonuclease/phosphatase family protein [Niastella sp.]